MSGIFNHSRRPLGAAIHLGGSIGSAAVRPAIGAVSTGVRLQRAGREELGRRLGDAALSALDAALTSSVAERAVDSAMASGLAKHAIGRALEGPLVDVIVADLVRYAVVERITNRLLADGIVEHTLGRVLDGPELERLVGDILASPAIERLVGQTIESRLVDQTVGRLLDSAELWLVIEEIARSPAVTEAIAHQGVGFADQVADGMRARSHNADAWLERTARRTLRRPLP